MKEVLQKLKRLHDVSLWRFGAILSAVYCLIFVSLEFYGVPVGSFYSFAVTAAQWAVVSVCTAGLLLLLSSNRLLFAATFPLLFTITGVMNYLRFTLGVRLTAMSIEIALVNDSSMWWSVISPMLLLVFAVSLLLGISVAVYRWKKVRTTRLSALVFGIAGVLAVMCPLKLVPRLSAPVGARLPYSIYFATDEYLDNRKTVAEYRSTFADTPVSASPAAPHVVVVLGESLRADHLPFNGYTRNTLPHLVRDTMIINFGDVYSEYTHTYVSVPHIMTRADSVNPERAYEEQSFVSLFKKAGYTTAWFANQDLSNSYAYFAHECDTLVYSVGDASLYSYNLWLDRDMEPDFEEWYSGNKARPHLAVLHTIGSHWWYKSHYTPEQTVFTPDIRHKDIGGLSREEIINAYDNTIISTDEFLSRIFSMLRGDNAVVLYISDHGESLGEDGLFLHGADSAPLHRPACFVWYTQEYAENFPEKVGALRRLSGRRFTTDAIFHTVLDIAGIETPALDKSQSFCNEYDEDTVD